MKPFFLGIEMARIRTIKPDFFNDEEIAELPPLGRLFFIGLWTLADTSDWVADDAAAIKRAIMPMDNVDVEGILLTLEVARLIQRADNKIQIVGLDRWCAKILGDRYGCSAARRARERRAMPAWADRKAISTIYREARRRRAAGEDIHVDHEIPLAGKLVCGLHVHQNLQIIAASTNIKKSNKFGAEE